MTAELRIICGGNGTGKGEGVGVSIDGQAVGASLSLSRISATLVTNLPDILADLLEIAAYVYAADSAIRRGGKVAEGMGADWRRRLRFVVPVRCRDAWERPEIHEALAETLGFLSDDHYAFEFTDHDGGSIRQRILFDLGGDDGDADEVLMFSGGLDSFAGAAEALFERQSRVALVSHHSAPFTQSIQATLVTALRQRTRPERVRHFRLEVKMRDGRALEGTHRSRSFLFAALGLVVARTYGRDRLDFYENGVVSLNFAPLEQFVGGRATRSTHPLALAMISRLFCALTGRGFKVGNPYLWRTKTEVIARISDLGLADLLPNTHSCANVRSANRMRPHCGRCSQCIDRRFAVLAAGCARDDPAEMYAVDLLSGDRLGADRELALAYVRNARAWRSMTSEILVRHHPEFTRALAGLDIEPSQGAKSIAGLCARHGQAVTTIMENALREAPEDRSAQSLVALYAAADHAPRPAVDPPAPTPACDRLLVEIDTARKAARLGGCVLLRGVGFEALSPLAEANLESLGAGRAPEDFALMKAARLLEIWKMADESSVRRRIQMLRRSFASAGAEDPEIIENLPWYGYRLKPEAVTVRRVSLAEALRRPPKTPGSAPAAVPD